MFPLKVPSEVRLTLLDGCPLRAPAVDFVENLVAAFFPVGEVGFITNLFNSNAILSIVSILAKDGLLSRKKYPIGVEIELRVTNGRQLSWIVSRSRRLD